jgi:hypothetical protein
LARASKPKTSGKDAAGKAKRVIEAWEKDGDREDQDYYHIPGSPEQDHEEVHSSTRGQKPWKS